MSLYLSRDLDSVFTAREAAAVAEWVASGRAVHVMRDHPWHGAAMLGGTWGTRLTDHTVREKWREAWRGILADKEAGAGRASSGPDQRMLKKYISTI